MRAARGPVSKLLSLFAGGALLCGCAANSGVISTGQNTFVVSRQAATGFSGSGNLKAEALSEASQYCTNQQKSVSVVNVREAQPPFLWGNFPKAEVQFTCWDATKIDAIKNECDDRRKRKEIKGFRAPIRAYGSHLRCVTTRRDILRNVLGHPDFVRD